MFVKKVASPFWFHSMTPQAIASGSCLEQEGSRNKPRSNLVASLLWLILYSNFVLVSSESPIYFIRSKVYMCLLLFVTSKAQFVITGSYSKFPLKHFKCSLSRHYFYVAGQNYFLSCAQLWAITPSCVVNSTEPYPFKTRKDDKGSIFLTHK